MIIRETSRREFRGTMAAGSAERLPWSIKRCSDWGAETLRRPSQVIFTVLRFRSHVQHSGELLGRITSMVS